MSFLQHTKCSTAGAFKAGFTTDASPERAIAHATETIDEAAAKFLKDNQERLR